MDKELKRLLVKLNTTKMLEWIVKYGKQKTWKLIERIYDAKTRLRFRAYYAKALKNLVKKSERNK